MDAAHSEARADSFRAALDSARREISGEFMEGMPVGIDDMTVPPLGESLIKRLAGLAAAARSHGVVVQYAQVGAAAEGGYRVVMRGNGGPVRRLLEAWDAAVIDHIVATAWTAHDIVVARNMGSQPGAGIDVTRTHQRGGLE